MGTHPIFESDFDCLTERSSLVVWNREMSGKPEKYQAVEFDVPKVDADGNPISKSEQKRMIKELKKKKEAEEKAKKKAEAAAANPQAEKAKAPGDGEENLTPNQYTEIKNSTKSETRVSIPTHTSSMLPLDFKNFVQSIPQLKLVVEVMTSSVLPVVFIQCVLPVQSLYFMIYEQKAQKSKLWLQ